MNLINLDNI